MYEQYWGLRSKPFENTADVRFYYPAEAQQGALLKLRYAIENRRGAALLAGAAGLGKTLLVRTVVSQLGPTYAPVQHVVFPDMPADQLVAYLAEKLAGAAPTASPSLESNVRRLEAALIENAAAGKHAVLVIDEAHLLEDQRTLETMRLLLNFEHQAQPALSLLLVGQPSILSALDRTPEFDERLGVKCLLSRFTPAETFGYVNHRMTTAGAQQEVFDDSALEKIHQLSLGTPRKINRLCDLALLIGFAEERTAITAAQIEAVAEELTVAAPE